MVLVDSEYPHDLVLVFGDRYHGIPAQSGGGVVIRRDQVEFYRLRLLTRTCDTLADFVVHAGTAHIVRVSANGAIDV